MPRIRRHVLCPSALIHAVYTEADRVKAASVYWMTQEFNAEGRALYDTLARRTSFIRYER